MPELGITLERLSKYLSQNIRQWDPETQRFKREKRTSSIEQEKEPNRYQGGIDSLTGKNIFQNAEDVPYFTPEQLAIVRSSLMEKKLNASRSLSNDEEAILNQQLNFLDAKYTYPKGTVAKIDQMLIPTRSGLLGGW